MKKVLTIISILFVVNCSAQAKFPIFGKKKYRGPRCGSKDVYRQDRRRVAKAIGIFVISAIGAGIAMESSKPY